MSLRHLVLPTFAATLLTAFAGSVRAQTPAPGFALDRYEPSERGSDWFAADSLDLRAKLGIRAGMVLDYAHDPLVLYQPDGTKISGIVSDQFFAHLGGALVYENRVRFALSLPVALVQGGSGGNAGSVRFASDNATALGDLRLGADVRLFGQYADPLTLGAGLQFFAPTGSQASFTSDGAVRLIPRVSAAGSFDPVVYSAGLGFQYRASDVAFAGDPRQPSCRGLAARRQEDAAPASCLYRGG